MNIFDIDVSRKKDGFDTLFDKLESIGKISIYPSHIMFLSNEDISSVENSINTSKELNIKQIKDFNSEISVNWLKEWIKEVMLQEAIEEAEKEVQERTNAMYDILVEANKKKKELEETAKNEEPKNSNETN